MSRHRFIYFILPTGLSFVLIALAACGGQAQDEAATSAKQADETSQNDATSESESVVTASESQPEPEDLSSGPLTDRKLMFALVDHDLISKNFLAYKEFNSNHNQFEYFYGDFASRPDKEYYKVISPTNQSPCAELAMLNHRAVPKNVASNIVRYQDNRYGGGSAFESYESVWHTRSDQGAGQDFAGSYNQRSFLFNSGIADKVFLNLVAAWANCTTDQLISLDDNTGANSLACSLKSREYSLKYFRLNDCSDSPRVILRPNAFVYVAKDEESEYLGIRGKRPLQEASRDLVILARVTGNVLEIDNYVVKNSAPALDGLLGLSDERAKRLAQVQGLNPAAIAPLKGERLEPFSSITSWPQIDKARLQYLATGDSKTPLVPMDEVPSVEFLPANKAVSLLEANGYAVQVKEVTSDSVPRGVVISQGFGQAKEGSDKQRVRLDVSAGTAAINQTVVAQIAASEEREQALMDKLIKDSKEATREIEEAMSGWIKYDDRIKYKWFDCTERFGYCWGIELISSTACPTQMYVEAAIIQNGKNVGFTNELTVGVKANETVSFRLLEVEGSGTRSARITKISCF